ncbi:hypothetical protein F5Y08DRAFT_346636 [Xylaria arbuscula]|nr:hypothetical protein F5Y08DRAFT_346636 [Xylaria arbuscula]
MEQECPAMFYCRLRKVTGKKCQKHIEAAKLYRQRREEAKRLLLKATGNSMKTEGHKRNRSELDRRRSHGRMERGLCVKCGKTPPEDDYKKCSQCRKRALKNHKAYLARRNDRLKKATKKLLEQESDLVVALEGKSSRTDSSTKTKA